MGISYNGKTPFKSTQELATRFTRGFGSFSRIKKLLGRTESRTRDRIYCQTMRTVRVISRDDRARIATCSLRNYSIDYVHNNHCYYCFNYYHYCRYCHYVHQYTGSFLMFGSSKCPICNFEYPQTCMVI